MTITGIETAALHLHNRMGMSAHPAPGSQADRLLKATDSLFRQRITTVYDFAAPDFRTARAEVARLAAMEKNQDRWLLVHKPGAVWWGRHRLLDALPGKDLIRSTKDRHYRYLDPVATLMVKLHYSSMAVAETARVTMTAHGFSVEYVPGQWWLDVFIGRKG